MANTPSAAPTKADKCNHPRPSKSTIALPVIETGPDGAAIRTSRSGKWRALSLLLVHVLILAHVLHWLSSGRTLSPIEPSESMETIKSGRINAGFIFFGGAILATMLLGRWVCGWACHLVAYQDITLWVLKKLHLRPKAFRTRFFMFIPLLAAVYMFIWPAIYRLFARIPNPPLTWHVTTTGFWDTFPAYGVAILTVLTCGVAIIYFLGPKGFCSFACPYGAFFGAVDKLAPARIRVTDACNQCGHCTAVCTSNVDVAQEVKLYKMVVDPGCMKCLDCVSVCPNDALYFGLGRPALGLAPSAPPRAKRYDLAFSEEIAAIIVFAGVFLAYRGLYGKVPFLMSLGCAGIAAYLFMKAASLFYQTDVATQKLVLKSSGRMKPAGILFLTCTTLLLAFTTHSGLWRYHDYMGQRALADLPSAGFGWQRTPGYLSQLNDEARVQASASRDHLAFCEKWGLLRPVDNELQIAWLSLLAGDAEAATNRVRRIAEAHPGDAGFWVKLANFETYRNRFDNAKQAFARALGIEKSQRESIAARHPAESFPISALVWAEWGVFCSDRGEVETAQEALEKAVKFDDSSTLAWLALGAFRFGQHQIDAARLPLIRAVTLTGGAPQPVELLERIGREDQDFAAAALDYDSALAASNERVFLHNRAHALARQRRYAEAIAAYRAILQDRPDAIQPHADLGAALLSSGDLPGAMAEYEVVAAKLPSDAEAQFKLGFLYQQAGRIKDAARQYQAVIDLGGQGVDLAREALNSLNSNPGP